MSKKDELIDVYNRHAPAMAEKFSKIGRRITDIERGLAYINKKNPKVIEIGCGNGRDAKEIISRVSDYTGIDISESMIKLARDYAPQGTFYVADMETYEFPKNIDIIFAFASLLHLNKESINKLLLRVYSCLNEHGIFYFSLKYDSYQEKIKVDEFGSRVFYYYNEKDIKELAAATGYKIIYENKQLFQGIDWLTIALRRG